MFSSQQRIKALWSIQLDKSHLCLTGEEKPPRFLNSESAAAPAANWPGMCQQRGKWGPRHWREGIQTSGLLKGSTSVLLTWRTGWCPRKWSCLWWLCLQLGLDWDSAPASSVLVPSISRLHQHHGDHSSDLFGTELWVLLRKGPVYKFISFSSQYIFFFNQWNAVQNPLHVLFHGLSGRHRELTGEASGWKWGCAKSFFVLGWEPVRNGFYEPHFPLSTWPEACHSRKSCFLLHRAWAWHSQPRGEIYRALTAGLTPWKTNTIYLSTTLCNKRGSKKQGELRKQNWWFYLFYDHSGENPPEKQTLSKGKWWSCGVKQSSEHGKSPFTWMRQETAAEILQTPKDTNGLSTDQI